MIDLTGKARTARFQELIKRKEKVLAMMHPPTAFHGKIMEKAGAEALFVGTAGVVGAYSGMIDVGVASMSECVLVGGWIAQSVGVPVMLGVPDRTVWKTGAGLIESPGGSCPVSRPISVVLPAPVCPTMATIFPAGTSNDRPSRIGRSAS